MTLAVQQADAFINGLGMSVLGLPLRGEPPTLDFPGSSSSKERVIKRFEQELAHWALHDSLMASAGLYARLFSLQARGFTDAMTGTQT